MRFRLHFTFLDLIDSTVMKLTKQMNHLQCGYRRYFCVIKRC